MDREAGLRPALVAAALGILKADGQEPSLRAVARVAGVSAMAPYRYFPDKAALLAAVANHGFGLLGDVLAATDEELDPCEGLFAQGMAFVGFAEANPALFRLMYSYQYGSADTEAVLATYRTLANRVAEVSPSQVPAATLACRALVQGMAAIVLNGRLAPSKPEDVATAIRLLVRGLVAGPG